MERRRHEVTWPRVRHPARPKDALSALVPAAYWQQAGVCGILDTQVTRSRDRRVRATGRRGSRGGELHAQILLEVMESPAYRSVPDYARSVLWAVCAQFRGNNNGNLSLTAAEAARLGVESVWKLRAGIRILVETGLLEVTRQGKYSHGKGICALYALTWREVSPTNEAYPPIIVTRPPSNAWAKWQKPHDWAVFERMIRQRARGSRRLDPEADFLRTPRGDQDGTPRQVREGMPRDPALGSKANGDGTPRHGHLLDIGPGQPAAAGPS